MCGGGLGQLVDGRDMLAREKEAAEAATTALEAQMAAAAKQLEELTRLNGLLSREKDMMSANVREMAAVRTVPVAMLPLSTEGGSGRRASAHSSETDGAS